VITGFGEIKLTFYDPKWVLNLYPNTGLHVFETQRSLIDFKGGKKSSIREKQGKKAIPK
jgi:hypothetical protein